MATDGNPIPAEDIETVATITSFSDHGIISNALRSLGGNVDSVINAYFDEPDKFAQKYGWDESAFSSGLESEATPANDATVPSFAIHAPVIYGTEPTTFYGAPSRPPSRATTKSPLSNVPGLTHSECTINTPSNHQEEEDQLRRAINESLNTPSMSSPRILPPPGPPPLPQQSGIISNENTSVYFGPANRPSYEPNDWAIVRVGGQLTDPEPSLRARKAGTPVLLRCRTEEAWKKHRLGALLMILHQIPTVRNALLRTGESPSYGYGSKNDWWLGKAILPPGQSELDEYGEATLPPWTDELHRLIAFLETSERSYGTADILSRAMYPESRWDTGDVEKDFFQKFSELQSAEGLQENVDTLLSLVEIVAFDDLTLQGGDYFGLLDLQLSKDMNPPPQSLYDILDWLFFVDPRLAREDPHSARMAWVTRAADVLTFRFQADDKLPRPIEMPETFYLDRYMSTNGTKMQELQMDTVTILAAHDAIKEREDTLIRWTNPQTNKTYDRRELAKAAVRRCRERIKTINNRAFWRNHEEAPADGEGDYYLPDHEGEPRLLPEEAKVVAHYEAKAKELEEDIAERERVLNETTTQQKQSLDTLFRKMSSLLTEPSTDEKWNPTRKYILRGIVNEPNTVYQRIRGPAGELESTAAGNGAASAEERWWKTSFRVEDATVEHIPISYEAVMREACATGCQPIVVYATGKAMDQERLPLSDALRSFVKLDNRHFKQEVSQSERLGHAPDKKRSAVIGNDSQSKRLQRSSSMDSMATNHASAGDFDEEMHDAPFDSDSVFGQASDTEAGRAAGQDDNIPDLEELPPPWAGEAPLPSYDDVAMETTVSPALDPESARLAQVSLHDVKSSSPPRPPEMQERPNVPFLTRPNNDSAANSSSVAGNSAAEEGPLIDLDDDDGDTAVEPRVNGVQRLA
ncbi:uncharacterized protein B0T15DRAFT_111614 [Chaetomium strumarium]|uniref:Ubiquitin interaction domain-containing protein n=1 Tax=Chaetomium strumarium TaxID=1170767 RepID=A0AAJ0GZ66_9PEZI|nr:hypothetical protein B0T15DRAFT_111614 [Chaetomium strumarium]